MHFSKMFIAAAFACGASTVAHAQHVDDVHLAMEFGEVLTGEYTGSGFEERRIWINPLNSGLTNDPGYEAPSGTFPGSSVAGIRARAALRVWDDVNGHFHSIAAETMVISRFSLMIETPPTDPCPGQYPSLQLGLVSGTGSFHVHPWYQLTAPAGDGLYLLELEFWLNSGMPPALVSKPFWVIFTKNEFDEEVIEEAEAWVFEHKVNVPTPCLGDISGDGNVGVADLLAMLAAWGPNPCHPADLNGDANVGVSDLLVLLSVWGPCP